MHRYLLYLLLLFPVLPGGCRSDEQKAGRSGNTARGAASDALEAVQEEPVRQAGRSDTTDFPAAFAQFFAALQAEDTAALGRYIDPQKGIWLIEQPGAVPAYTHFQTIRAVQRHYQHKPFTSLKEQLQACELEERQEFPRFDCAWMDKGRSGYAADGCFYHNTTDFKTSDMWRYASLSPQQEQEVQQLQQQVLKTVLHTRSSYRFYFTYDGTYWRLLFADMRTPCSA